MNVQQLRKAVPALKALRRPVRLAGGLVARWSGPAAAIAGVTLVPTYFFAGGELRRVEYLATNAGASAFAALLHWGRASWGVELATQDPGAASASWSTDDMDIYLQHASGAQVPRLRLVVKRRALKDASEL